MIIHERLHQLLGIIMSTCISCSLAAYRVRFQSIEDSGRFVRLKHIAVIALSALDKIVMRC